MILGILGAGASGMAAALAASENPETQVLLLERQARVGKKLSATGNGRCNLTNLHASEGGYFGEAPAFARPALSAFPPEETLDWFRSLGLYTVAEDSGRVYPFSDQANSVVDVLRFSLNRTNITLKTGFEVEKIKKTPEGFRLESAGEGLSCDRLIIAAGGLAGTALGGSMSGYRLLMKLGHHATRLRPALVQLKTDWAGVESLKGIRTECVARVYRNEELFAESKGQVQFTQYGLSGPVIFEVSRDVGQGSARWKCLLDLLPEISEEDLQKELFRRLWTGWAAEELLTGILHNRLGRVIARRAGVKTDRDLSAEAMEAVAELVKAFPMPINEPMGMDSAQVTAGGIRTEEFDPETMESRLVPGLYACGEVLDIDGACGGYNLQWAWSSGRLAGRNAGEIG